MKVWRWSGSLRTRLLVATLISLLMALSGAHWWLSSLFRDHVMRQFDQALIHHLDQLTARLEFGALGQPFINPRGLSDPRWDKPYSGLYWQVDRMRSDGQAREGVLRSRSLWDVQLSLHVDELADGSLHTHEALGPQGHGLRVVERSIAAEPSSQRWRLLVAADAQEAMAAVDRFDGVLAASLAILRFLLALAALAQVAVGLSPLRAMQRSLQQVRGGRAQRLQGQFPSEVQPLIDDFNAVLDRHAQVVERARTQAGNLAHALKTPLAVLGNAARQAPGSELGTLVGEQVQVAQRHIQWHLARARAAAAHQMPGQRTELAPLLQNMVGVMKKVHASKPMQWTLDLPPPDWAFAGEAQDLQEMLGNLLDNAGRSARSLVQIRVQRDSQGLHILIDDDGPGIAPEQRQTVLQRGARIDESTPGSGLGLAIVVEVASLYQGSLELERSVSGGLSARLRLPAVAELKSPFSGV